MDWDLQDFGWEATSLDLDPKQDHDHHDDRDLGFTNSAAPQKIITVPQKHSPDDDGDEDEHVSAAGPKRAIGAHKAASCLVDGCEADLSGCREYHKRHRVCERHSKTPIVVVKGEEKRFCQQCSRFHSLGEFDEVKRSCRKRLDGHNRRRRKSHPHPLYFTSKNFMSAYKGPRILQFGNPVTKAGTESWLYSNPMSDEEIPLPIESGGRALYLLSTTQTPRHPNINDNRMSSNNDRV